MNRQSWILLGALGLLGGLYVRYFTDWFSPPVIQVSVTSRPGFGAVEPGSAETIVFALDHDWALDQVRVISLASLATNRQGTAVWQLSPQVPQQASQPLRGFAYGSQPTGLKCGPNPSSPQPLLPGAPYRIEVQSGRYRGMAEFVPRPAQSH